MASAGAAPGKSVAILGAGPSGLAACKAALEEGLEPVVFEKAPGVGGLWRQDGHGKVWKNLRTNLSKYTCAFSDAPWPKEAPDFPSGSQVQRYLEDFAEVKGLLPFIKFGTEVTSLERVAESERVDESGAHLDESQQGYGGFSTRARVPWRLAWKSDAKAETLGHDSECGVFANVIVATGIFGEPRVPNLPGLADFQGEVLHSSAYKNPSRFAGKHVLVVGAAFSGADISADIASEAKSVRIAARRPIWYLPRYIAGKPADLVFYSRAGSDKNKDKTEEERNSARHGFFAKLLESAGGIPDGLATPKEANDLPYVAITDDFLEAVRKGNVKAIPSSVSGFEGKNTLLSDGSSLEVDTVVMATGYKPSLSFMSPQLLARLEFDPEDWLQPLVLHETVWRPELPGLAFIGLYRGPYFAVMELQARWACGIFSGRLPAPTDVEAVAGLETERSIRSKEPRPQFPHGDYVGMAETLAKRVGVYPNGILSDGDHPLCQLIYTGPLLPCHYRLEGFSAKKELAEAALRACADAYSV